MDFKIKNLTAREILDSRGNSTIEVGVYVGNFCGFFGVPAGASTGKYEAVSKQDKKESIKNVLEIIAPKLKGVDVRHQAKIDEILLELDGTDNKEKLGADAMLGVSIASAKAAAATLGLEPYEYLANLIGNKELEFPLLYMNLVNGGKHSASFLAFQEYMIVSQTRDIEEAISIGARIMHAMRPKILERYSQFSLNIGDEGGYVLEAKKVEEPLQLLIDVIGELGFQKKVKLALDVAASSFYEDKKYHVDQAAMDTQALLEMYKNLIKKYDILSIEDPFEENDFENFSNLLASWKKGIIMGDDLTVTNLERLKKAHKAKSINAIIIKPNQIGTLTETLKAIEFAKENGIKCIVSHRSGETNDDFIADLAYAVSAFGIKAGAPRRGERIAKYNRLRQIYSKETRK